MVGNNRGNLFSHRPCKNVIVPNFNPGNEHCTLTDDEMVIWMLQIDPEVNENSSDLLLSNLPHHCKESSKTDYCVVNNIDMLLSLSSMNIDPNHINVKATDAESIIYSSIYHCKKKSWKLEKCMCLNISTIIMDNPKDYGYQGLDMRRRILVPQIGLNTASCLTPPWL